MVFLSSERFKYQLGKSDAEVMTSRHNGEEISPLQKVIELIFSSLYPAYIGKYDLELP